MLINIVKKEGIKITNQIDSGIGFLARKLFSPGQSTPEHGSPSHGGMHSAIIVDDIDEQKMGRVWVYIPGISARNPNLKIARYSPTRKPMNSDGTPGEPIESMRSGFIRAFPISPHSGSDKMRESPKQPDGRNPGSGQSNSYGMFSQGRNGDSVVVTFLNGDPSKAYIVGHIPQEAQNSNMPSYKPTEASDAKGSGYSTNIGPTYETGQDSKPIKASTLFDNLTDGGLISDNLRGLGSSSSTRESPSRVWGIKTPGDPDTNMMGHQLVLDDHPNSQLMRLRTSKGSQILLCDNGDFIYMSTKTGKTWVQIDDSGNVNIFAHSSVSIHAEQDINYMCDRDFNLHVGGNFNQIVKGDTRIRMNGGGNITVGEGGGDLDITTINNFHVKSQAEFRMSAKEGITHKSGKFIGMQATNNITMKTPDALNTDTQIINFKASGSINQKAGGNFNIDGAQVLMTNGSLSVQSVSDSPDANQADIPIEHSVTAPPQTSGPPTSPTGMMKSGCPIVPQHEPWPGHPSSNPGYNASMNPSSIPKLL